jgi:hypothetical protein
VENGAGQTPLERQDLAEGLETGLLIWEAWRYAPDPFFIRERVYPLLRAATVFAIDRCQSSNSIWNDARIRSRVATALGALLWAGRVFEIVEPLTTEWRRLLSGLGGQGISAPPEMQPFGLLKPADTVDVFRSLIRSVSQQAGGLFGDDPGSPDLAFPARLGAGLSALLLSERALPAGAGATAARSGLPPQGFGGAPVTAIEVFGGLPPGWGAAFSMAAPGGFRIHAESGGGRPRYVAVKSVLGGLCRIVNPWGKDERVNIVFERSVVSCIAEEVIEFDTEPGTTYLIERQRYPLARSVTARLVGRPSAGPRESGACLIGIPAAVRPESRRSAQTRLPAESPPALAVVSRIERARSNLAR